ncbi:MAG: hypothetical protein R3E02_04735 [Blastomonas sp.]
MQSGFRQRLGASIALAALVIATGPAMGQNDAPESLLPPGFDQPSPSPSEPPPPAPAQPAPQPRTPQPASPAEILPSVGTPGSSSPAQSPADAVEEDESLEEQFALAASLPPEARQSLMSIGVMTPDIGGFRADALGNVRGPYVASLLRSTGGRLVSRWGTILLRRALVSRLDTPAEINGANWAAERASMLLRVGDVDSARRIVQQVDGSDYSPQMFDVAQQVYLASADPAGICPAMPFLPDNKSTPQWRMLRAICASFAGEQGRAGELIDRALAEKVADEIDMRLAEKAVGAGINGRRAVTIEWEGVDRLTSWRFGLALATGLEPPAGLYQNAGRRFQAWRAGAPMVPVGSRMEASNVAGAMGVMSNGDMVDLYGAAYDDPAAGDDKRAMGALLRSAYAQRDPADRYAAMTALWDRNENAFVRYSSLVLTAVAAARFPVSDDYADESSTLIASMLSAGYDRSAMRWARIVPEGSLGWALLALSAPRTDGQSSEQQIDAFVDDDDSEEARKSRFLVAGLAGLGRIADGDRTSFEERLDFSLARQTRWTRAIDAAATRKDEGMVAILAAVGMQGDDWSAMTPLHLYHIVRSLRMVGLEAEARMIAAEAVTRA